MDVQIGDHRFHTVNYAPSIMRDFAPAQCGPFGGAAFGGPDMQGPFEW